ncbi:Fe-S cluster assembly protein SufD [Aliidongia dinghuensis]|uniref:Fe-S cluster assembly protein SufD n=1 Tax=Aliidongia dinghuensis TaxID=1867774 RepID=A0A8J2YXR3_9PROT|nr:Fe-S cluster assembly protein SufD [Aliidongia dinghuensis]GGF36963.1 Fe-S cluster assembly protein SufD [Aliidongia dinghuensis]
MSAVPFLETLAVPANQAEPAWLGTKRAEARQRFAEAGFPTKRHEAWRFTELKGLTGTSFAPAPAKPGNATVVGERLCRLLSHANRLVFVNGRFDPDHSHICSLPPGVFLGSFADWLAKNGEADALFERPADATDAFRALNQGLFTDGLALIVPAGVTLDDPVHVLYWGEADASASVQAKGLIRIGTGAQVTVIESFAGVGATWTNAAMTVEVADHAKLGHYRLQDEDLRAFHTGTLDVSIGADAIYDGFTLSLGAAMARQDIRAKLVGERAFCGVSGVYLLAERQESTVASVIEHLAPHGETKEVFKGCLADRSHGVFQGQIKVAQVAQKTDAYQLNKTVLLSDRAVMDTKPELEIFADDVKCSHGATVGDLDEAAEFYLRSRGIAPEQARAMLIEAFVVDAVELVSHEQARDYLTDAIGRWLAFRHPEK